MHLRRPLAAVVLAVLLPFLWCFGSTLTGARVGAYRDIASFYYPLYAWTSRTWRAGQMPRWNPQDGIGMPVAAEATAAVFYPGQLLLALPIDYPLKFNLYVAIHILLAAGTASCLAWYLLARLLRSASGGSLECGPASNNSPDPKHRVPPLRILSAGFCGLSYAFSGAVLFQYCNIVFLVGAAWLPLALLSAMRMLAQRSHRWALALGLCLSMMVLGGDPQAAYHSGLLAVFWAWYQRPRVSPALARSPRHKRIGWGRWPSLATHAFSLLATAAISGAAFSAVQIVPAIHLTGESDRAAFKYPRSIYEAWPYLMRSPAPSSVPGWPANGSTTEDTTGDWSGVAKGLFSRPEAGTHHQQLYAFSVAPWRLAESVWPNISGKMFPKNQRWLTALHAEDRVWTPTLYLGLMPLLIALATWRWRTHDRTVSWLSWVACGSLVASFGWYGPGWVIDSLQSAWTGEPTGGVLGEPTGGLYWLLVTALPGYAYFRYPAKLLVITSLALALLAAVGFERLLTSERGRLRRLLGIVGATSGVAACALAACRIWWSGWFAGASPDELYGPLDVQGAWIGCVAACLHTAVACSLFWWLLRRERWPAVRTGMLILIITALELGWANGWSVLTVPTTAIATPNRIDRLAAGSRETVRLYRPPERRWVPQTWLEQSEVDRGEATVRWDRATLLPKYHLLGPLGSVDSVNTLASRDYRAFLAAGGTGRPHRSVLEALAVRYLILPQDEDWPTSFAHLSAKAMDAENARLWISDAPLPRVWIVHRVERWPLNNTFDPAVAQRRYDALLFPAGQPRDLRREAVVETESPAASAAVDEPATAGSGEACHLVSEQASRLDVEAELSVPGLIVLSNLYESGWAASVVTDNPQSGTVSQRSAEIVRTDGVMQGVFLPAGRHHVTFQYAPRYLYWSAATSCISWCLLLLLSARWCLVRGRRDTCKP